MDFDMAYASALKVDLTTLAIFLEIHTMGTRGASTFSFKRVLVAQMIEPWCELKVRELAKEASSNETKVMSSRGMGK